MARWTSARDGATPALPLPSPPLPSPLFQPFRPSSFSTLFLIFTQEDVKAGRLSGLQLETVLYSFARYEQERLPDGSRRAFFLGDGAGVGKVCVGES